MARRFTIKERIDLVRNYYSSGNNASEAARKAGENPLHASTVMRLIRKFEESESFADEARSGRPSVSKSEDFQRVVLEEIDSNTPTSTRRIARNDKVYSHNPITLDQLRSLISQQLQTIDVSLCRKMCRSVRDRMAKCVQNEGGHFEHLL